MAQPNIIFITTDTQGREMVSAYVDRPGVHTPQIDQLAQSSVVFENCYVACPLCTPSRAAWYTGRHPNRAGAWGNEMTIGRHVPMLAELLQEQGYAAYHVGKWHLDGAGYNGTGQSDGGFDPSVWYDLTNFYHEVGRDGPNRFGGWNKGFEDEACCYAHRVADRAIDVLKQQHDFPFFLAVEFDEPHGPYICPPPYHGRNSQADIYKPSTFMADLSDKPKLQQDYAAYLANLRTTPDMYPGYYHLYYDCNAYVDYEIGRVIEAVEQFAPSDTVIVFTSDHGDHLGAFGLGAKGPTMYDHTTRVPLIIRAPHLTGESRREAGLVSSVDLPATILDIAGLSINDDPRFVPQNGYSWQSLVPVLRGEQTSVHDAVYIEYNRFGKQFEQVNGLYPIRCIVTEDWKLSINLFDTDELYERQSDPEEAINRINDGGLHDVRIDLHDRLIAWQKQIHDVFRGPQWGIRHWRPDYQYAFEGLTTTGYKDDWHFGRFE